MDVVLIERHHEEVLAQLLQRIAGKRLRHLTVDLLELAHEILHPHRAVLHRDEADVGMASGHAVADERRDHVEDRAAHRVEHATQRIALVEAAVLKALAARPLAIVLVVARIRQMQVDEDLGFGAARPEGVELGGAGRLARAIAGDRCRTHADRARATGQRPFQLVNRQIDVGQADDGGGENATLAGKAPFLVHPLVQRMHHAGHQHMVMVQPLFDHRSQRREKHRGVQTLLVHQLQPVGRGAERLGRRDWRALQVFQRQAVRVLRTIPLLMAAGGGHDFESGVGNVVGDLPGDGQLGAATHLNILELVAILLRQIAQEGIFRFVVVIVRIIDGIGQLGHPEFLSGFIHARAQPFRRNANVLEPF